jgi:hypothetical protein
MEQEATVAFNENLYLTPDIPFLIMIWFMDCLSFRSTHGGCRRRKKLLLVQSFQRECGLRGLCFFIDILGKKVYGQDYAVIGKVIDLTARSGDGQPEIDELVLLAPAHIYFPAEMTFGHCGSREIHLQWIIHTASPRGGIFLFGKPFLESK